MSSVPGPSDERDGRHGRHRLVVLGAGATSAHLPDATRLLVLDRDAEPWNPAAVDVVIAPHDAPVAARPEVVGVEDVGAAIDVLERSVGEHPQAAGALTRHLRAVEGLDVPDGLVLESRLFSELLAGEEFAGWLAARGTPRPPDDLHRVLVDRVDDDLVITLDRPARRNAYDAAMRDQLLEALEIAKLDPAVRVTVRGSGPDFCAGGDLDEFGTARDLVAAHRTRVAASPGRAIHGIRERVAVEVHGNAIGSGIEIAAFAGTVRATPGARFGLPELTMGLVPGAGGTVSLTRRVGRHRLLWWALTGTRLDATTARSWGLVDELLV